MANPHSSSSAAVQNFPLAEFRQLCQERDAMAYQAVGCAEAALVFLRNGDSASARQALASGLERYDRANSRIDQFRKEHSDGNAAA